MKIKLLSNADLKTIKPDSMGLKIMQDKADMLFFQIDDLNKTATQILKQNALSLNAELVTPREAILGNEDSYKCILFGSKKSMKLLVQKLKIQPFGLSSIAKNIQEFLHIKAPKKRKIMAIVNIKSNSFFTEFHNDIEAINHIYKLIDSKIDIIDIGAVSSRPKSKIINYKEELKRLKYIFDEIKNNKIHYTFSIDTYNKEVVQYAIECGFSIINDISGNVENMLGILKENKNISYVLNHIKGTPENMQDKCEYKNVILDIDRYFEKKLQILHENNIENIILDVGIGFGKNYEQNIEILKNLNHFNRFKKDLLVGLSNKSVIKKIVQDCEILDFTQQNSIIQNSALFTQNMRDASLIAGIIALKNGANILRTHSYKEYQIARKICEIFDIF